MLDLLKIWCHALFKVVFAFTYIIKIIWLTTLSQSILITIIRFFYRIDSISYIRLFNGIVFNSSDVITVTNCDQFNFVVYKLLFIISLVFNLFIIFIFCINFVRFLIFLVLFDNWFDLNIFHSLAAIRWNLWLFEVIDKKCIWTTHFFRRWYRLSFLLRLGYLC